MMPSTTPSPLPEDTGATFDVTPNDTHAAAVTFAINDDANHGNVTDHGDGTFSYAPDADFFGTDLVTYTAVDINGDSETATVSITVTPVVDVVDDTISTTEDTPVDGDVSVNDLFTGSVTFVIHDDATHGTVTTTPTTTGTGSTDDGTFTYTPDPDFVGTDTLTYTATDAHGNTETGTVNVTVTPLSDVVDDSVTTAEDTAVSGDVTTNDTFATAATFVVHDDAVSGTVW